MRRLALLCVLTTTALLGTAGSAWAAPDYDGDGTADGDCAPLDGAVHPGATDKPDLSFEDTNCDGIDGDQSGAIFVSLGGNDAAPGTKTNPMRTITAAVAAASAANRDVYIAGGTYDEGGGVPLADNVGLYGGYAPISGARSSAETTTIQGSPQAVFAAGDTGVVLQLLTLRGTPNATKNAYGMRAIPAGADPSRVALVKVTASGADAVGGDDGENGTTGAAGGVGNNGGGACANGGTRFGAGGFGGAGGAGGNNAGGANGSTGGAGSAFGGTGGGLLGTLFGIGNAGGAGTDGATASNNSAPAASDASAWPLNSAASGFNGGAGGGGGGGRGGTGDNNFGVGICGGGGGSGGTGGGGGTAGAGGQNGGGSFGIFMLNSSVVAVTSAVTGGKGGNGGDGGNGAFGGGGGFRGAGGAGDCVTIFVQVCGQNGSNGGNGGPGGRGGGGGGGAGGPSVGVLQAGPGSGYAAKDGTTESNSAASLGGTRGNGLLVRAASGQATPIMRSGSAPDTSTADFDGDGLNDPADACPEIARGGSDGNGDGCPDRPARLADANGNGVPDNQESSAAGGSTAGSTTTTTTAAQTQQAAAIRAPAIAALLSAKGRATATRITFTRLRASGVPIGATITATCTSKKRGACPWKSKRTTARTATVDLIKAWAARRRGKPGTSIAFKPGAVLVVKVAKAGMSAKSFRYTMAARKFPKATAA